MFLRKILAPLFSAIIALPVCAQQTNPASGTQTTAPADQSSSSSPARTATGEDPLQERHGNFWDGDEPGVASLLLHPFASKAYVQRQLRPIRDRLNELDELTAANSKMVKDVDTNAGRGIQLATEKTNEADQHATDAATKAQTAQETATQANKRADKIEGAVTNLDAYKSTNQIELHFRPGQRELSADSKRALDELATAVKGQRGYVIELRGFSRGSGATAISASRQMAGAVQRYLVLQHGIPAYRIYVQAMGGASVANGEHATGKQSRGGRIEVTVLKNDLDQLATSGSSDSPR